jgi:hypothetical protein
MMKMMMYVCGEKEGRRVVKSELDAVFDRAWKVQVCDGVACLLKCYLVA